MLGAGLTPPPLALVLGTASELAICGACWHARQRRQDSLAVQPGPHFGLLGC